MTKKEKNWGEVEGGSLPSAQQVWPVRVKGFAIQDNVIEIAKGEVTRLFKLKQANSYFSVLK